MYSQCPTCKAIYSVSEADLAAHHGLVRCGYCSGVFNARTNEVDGLRAKPDDGADGATGDLASPAGEQTGAGPTAPSRAPGEEEAAGRSHAYQDRAAAGTDGSPGVEEDHDWKVPGPDPDEQAPDYFDQPLIEPVLPEPPEVAAPEEATPEEAAPGAPVSEVPPLDDVPMGGPATREPARQEATGEAAAPEEAPRSQAPKEEPALQESIREEGAAPEQAASEQAEPEEAAPEEGVREASVREGVLREEPSSQESEPDEPEPAESEPEEMAPEVPARAAPSAADEPDLPGEITEEITIEAPPVLWNAFDEDTEENIGRHPSTGGDDGPDAGMPGAVAGRREPASAVQGNRAGPAAPGAAGGKRGRRAPLRSPYGDPDIAMVELPQPKPFKTATLSLLTVLLALLLVWQAKTFYLDDLAQAPVLRPYLESLCRPLGCVLPPRRDFARIDLVGTSIDVNPEYPGALEIQASLINRAGFSQPYPPLRVTLTDREGRVVGRRTYLPSEYRASEGGRLPVREVRNVSINLAQPAENAVGYEVELIAPLTDGEG